MPRYTVRMAHVEPPLNAEWNDPAWAGAEMLEVAHFRPEGSEHRPATHARLLYDAGAIHGIFHVADRFVRCVHTRHNDPVCRDSAVEFFVQPRPERGYLNFEFNCGGALLAYYITDHRRVGDAFAAYTPLSERHDAQVLRRSSLPPVVEPEMPDPVEWTLQFRIPQALLEEYTGPTGPMAGQHWRANFYKCGDETSHPHWAAWSPVSGLNFHLPECFGEIRFE